MKQAKKNRSMANQLHTTCLYKQVASAEFLGQGNVCLHAIGMDDGAASDNSGAQRKHLFFPLLQILSLEGTDS